MTFDLAIVGSGFGGSLLAMVARRLGKSVLLLERGSHPRFAIGESTSPLMNLLIEELAHTYDLPRLLPLATYGTWKTHYPELGVGLKRGFTYYGTQPGERLLVAASPGDPCADTHWLRADVDHFLVKEAIALGAEYHENTPLTRHEYTGGLWHLNEHTARFLVDATGPGKLWSNDVSFAGYPKTEALYSHFVGVRGASASLPGLTSLPPAPSLRLKPNFVGAKGGGGPTPTRSSSPLPSSPRSGNKSEGRGRGRDVPYPPDAAASHYVFPGGWMWILPFDNGVTSAGFAVESWLADELELAGKRHGAWERFLARFPAIQAQFADAQPVEKWHYAPKLSYRAQNVVGDGYLRLPSAAGFIDPLYSTGMPLTLLGIQRIAALIQHDKLQSPELLAHYEATTFAELDWVAEFIGANYAAFADFPRFVDTTMFYFAAASFSELARRTGRSDLAKGYLLTQNERFRANFHAWQQGMLSLTDAIAPWNAAGLADPSKDNLYGVDLEDVVKGASKLEKTEEELREIVATADWAQC
ncbi:NAD(P)/FAD-dependent oxidoreductase [Armatimonas rosea]|uniref:FADH2 O2-dependent halogenase n=1 Tax=Armatimonas rosea TaxID=685828 RepID=A0A7W9WAM6_ARMRO|nr:tryptophan 7-halogenase [Armatimonas rosea]MBB6053777.1 FADH2 O2-dependent halogenase [Armatimonas rosea]